ncbi:T9SS type A sorting domain-containing protein [Flavobacterium sp. ANB]|uniref:T9SS-dependent choice-of-anchor J family protein n=1 Tax=unclassified Flavobacterium TaxID=196869 RepID=UPI0012B9B7F2|nr:MULTISPECIES: T9SS type A sorting domain-containing protein [unclassified Flavobacterium]MBF4516884.1 T9SS type A sorting domain-containing protein [Flavobacterium sp. ANB]MTD69220.1 T9SS type A sorting domain-containing protein [Flavobacterium sp. LC2016-13]
MKRNLLLLVFIMISGIASAQYTIWEDDFDDADASDWTLLDKDANGSNWMARKNIQFTETVTDGIIDVLGTYNIDFATGGQLETNEDNLAISPALDISFYSGKIKLILNAQPAIYDSNEDLLIYASTSPDPASFKLLNTITLERLTGDEAEFKDYTVDISQFKGETTLYIALGNKLETHFIGYEINKISVVAESLLGVNDVDLKSSLCRIKQNPVQNNLELQIAEEFQTEETKLQIFNLNGLLIKESPYKPEGLSVEGLSQGIYFLSVTNNGVSQKLKFIKK